jgi:hypothetical protein
MNKLQAGPEELLKPNQKVYANMLLLIASCVTAHAQINHSNWGYVTAPVYRTTEKPPYSNAELSAGPDKSGATSVAYCPTGALWSQPGSQSWLA